MTNGIMFTVQDDDQTDRTIDSFVDLLNKNLDALRKDWSIWPARIGDEVKQAADLRTNQIRGQQERDAKSKYPIRQE